MFLVMKKSSVEVIRKNYKIDITLRTEHFVGLIESSSLQLKKGAS
jgi:hypothetical protein